MNPTNKKVLIFDVWAFTPYTEISLEIAEKHKAMGDIVQIVNLATKLPHWEYIPLLATKSHYKAVNYRLVNKLQMLANFAAKKGISYSSESLLNKNMFKLTLPEYITNVDLLKDFHWHGYDMGMGIASHLISRTKDMEPDIEKYRDVINNVFNSSVFVLDSFKKWSNHFNPDLVYIYNARTPLNRTVLRYCHKSSLGIRVVDRGGAVGKYTITPTYNHDRIVKIKDIDDYWENSPLSTNEKEKVATGYYLDRINGISTSRFVGSQAKDLLPPDFNNNEKNITFFTGSFTEHAAIDKENSADTLFDNQFQAVREIANFLSATDYRFFLRIHPNTIKKYPREYDKWHKLQIELKGKVTYIGGDNPVDSYALAKNSDKVVVHMTSVGIEAAFLGVPSIVVGNSRYHRLGSNYAPTSKQELFELLTTDDLPPKKIAGALKYGFYYAGAGYDFEHFVYTDKYLGLYDGIDFNHLKSYPIKTRFMAYMLFFLDQFRAKGLFSAVKTFFNKEKMANFIKNPISEM
jgi:hypothetical protein